MAHASRADDSLITTFGRLVEAHSGLGQQLGRTLEQRCGIPLTWYEVLLRISRSQGGQISMGALAQEVALTTGGITRLIDRMIAAGLVERVPCSTDRRVHFAALTKQGRTKLNVASKEHAANLRQAFVNFSAQDLGALDDYLDRLRAVRLG